MFDFRDDQSPYLVHPLDPRLSMPQIRISYQIPLKPMCALKKKKTLNMFQYYLINLLQVFPPYDSMHKQSPKRVLLKGVLRNFVKFTGKKTCARVSILKQRLWHGCFPVNFTKFLRTPLTEHLWWLLLQCIKLTDG